MIQVSLASVPRKGTQTEVFGEKMSAQIARKQKIIRVILLQDQQFVSEERDLSARDSLNTEIPTNSLYEPSEQQKRWVLRVLVLRDQTLSIPPLITKGSAPT